MSTYPVNIRGDLSSPPERGWWLIKWLLVIPHIIILFFLMIASVIVCVIAFFAILFTGKYPRGLFDFNTGVLRGGVGCDFLHSRPPGSEKISPFQP